MKNTLLMLIFTSLLSGNLYAAKTMSIKEVVLPVDINTAKIKWTSLGYGNNYLVKVIVPAIAGVTVLNHRNIGEDGPCLFTYGTSKVDDVVQGNPETIDVSFTITLEKFLRPSGDGDKCNVTMSETLVGYIRGFRFMHTETHIMPSRHINDCN